MKKTIEGYASSLSYLQLTLVSPAPDELVLLVRGLDGALYANWFKNGGFEGFKSLGGYLHAGYPGIAAMSREENKLESDITNE